MRFWRNFSSKQRVIICSILLAAVTVPVLLWSRSIFFATEDTTDSVTTPFAINFIVKETVGNKLLPARGFVVVKTGCLNPRRPDATRLYLTEGGTYCKIQASTDEVSIDSASFTSTRHNKTYHLPLSGEKSLSKFWVSESVTIEVSIGSDGKVNLTTEPTRLY